MKYILLHIEIFSIDYLYQIRSANVNIILPFSCDMESSPTEQHLKDNTTFK